jgi:hypothetical protein
MRNRTAWRRLPAHPLNVNYTSKYRTCVPILQDKSSSAKADFARFARQAPPLGENVLCLWSPLSCEERGWGEVQGFRRSRATDAWVELYRTRRGDKNDMEK